MWKASSHPNILWTHGSMAYPETCSQIFYWVQPGATRGWNWDIPALRPLICGDRWALLDEDMVARSEVTDLYQGPPLSSLLLSFSDKWTLWSGAFCLAGRTWWKVKDCSNNVNVTGTGARSKADPRWHWNFLWVSMPISLFPVVSGSWGTSQEALSGQALPLQRNPAGLCVASYGYRLGNRAQTPEKDRFLSSIAPWSRAEGREDFVAWAVIWRTGNG
jgi:hypothetical protein